MPLTTAFDLALFVRQPASVDQASVVTALGPPFTSAFKTVPSASKPGLTVASSIPAASTQDQILVSGPAPNYDWGLASSPDVGATIPAPIAQYDVILANAVPAWTSTPFSDALTVGGAVTNAGGGSFVSGANLAFATTGALSTRINGTDPALSRIDNFTIDCGTY